MNKNILIIIIIATLAIGALVWVFNFIDKTDDPATDIETGAEEAEELIGWQTYGKGKDARIQSAVIQARTQAELIWADTASYDDLCDGGFLNATGYSHLQTLHDDIVEQQGEDTNPNMECCASGNDYCVAAALVASDDWFCVDGEGRVVDNATDAICVSGSISCQ